MNWADAYVSVDPNETDDRDELLSALPWDH